MVAVVGALLLALPAAASADVTPLGLTCQAKEGVRLCQGAKVKTFDGVPLDTDVALPATGDSALPLVVLLHGWGGSKSGFADEKAWAQRGYAVAHLHRPRLRRVLRIGGLARGGSRRLLAGVDPPGRHPL